MTGPSWWHIAAHSEPGGTGRLILEELSNGGPPNVLKRRSKQRGRYVQDEDGAPQVVSMSVPDLEKSDGFSFENCCNLLDLK